jgi:hypothetical protein
MDRTKRIKRLLLLIEQKTERVSGRLTVRKRNALKNSPLGTLPTEVLQVVAEFLPIASAASLTLSCRRIYFLLGTQYLENLTYDTYERLAFLRLLEHDLLGYIICDDCRILQKIKDARHYTLQTYGTRYLSPEGMLNGCLSEDMHARVPSYIFENFSTTVFKMTMKHYRHFGLDAQCQKLLKILLEGSSTEWRDSEHISARTEQAECRIKDGSLFIRHNVCFRITSMNRPNDIIRFPVCPHLELNSENKTGLRVISLPDRSLEKRWSLSLPGNRNTMTQEKPWDLCSELSQCRHCRTEYQVEFTHNDGRAMKCTITIWKNLGQGPDTKTWRAHLPRQRSGPEVKFQSGEVASVFKKRGPKTVVK